MAKVEISIPHVLEKFIPALRERKGFKTNAETIEYMLPIAASRINATTKYARDHKPEPKPKKAKAAKPAPVKKATKKSAPKGPLARKAKAAAKAKPPKVVKPAASKIEVVKGEPEKAPAAAPAEAVAVLD